MRSRHSVEEKFEIVASFTNYGSACILPGLALLTPSITNCPLGTEHSTMIT
jgi:hypothetical protein